MQALSIGEVAARAGVSVRALRLYEAAGLLAPSRTEAGRRSFSAGDLARLQQILALKRAGCTLSGIGELLALRTIDPAGLIDLQIAVLQRQKTGIDRSLTSLRAARARLVDGREMSLGEFCDIIKLGETTMDEAGWQLVWDRYYTPEEQERWKAAKIATPEAERSLFEGGWADLIGRVEAAVARGAQPAAEASMALAKEWYDLQKPLVEKVGAEIWNKGFRMYTEMEQWRTATVRSPFSREVMQFIAAAAEAARAKGLIPPRLSAA